MAIVGLSPQILEKRKRDERGTRETNGGKEGEEERVFFSQLGAEKARGWPWGWRTLDRTLWSAIIGGVGPRVSGKANFLAAREFSHRLARKTRSYISRAMQGRASRCIS